MKQLFYLSAFCLLALMSCNSVSYKKADNGLEYRIVKGQGGTNVRVGNTIKYAIAMYYVGGGKDSLLTPAMDTLPKLLAIDTTYLPKNFANIFMQAQKGDSIITRMLLDTIRKHSPGVPPSLKNGYYISSRIKVLDVYTDSATIKRETTAMQSAMMTADSNARAAQLIKDDKVVNFYLSTHNIQAVKAPKGTYVHLDNPGSGDVIDTSKAVTVNYKGMTFAGDIFDQSYDSTGKPTRPFTFLVGQHMVIPGWEDAITLFKKGGKGTIYIPSALAYGARPMGGKIAANENLIFELEVTDVMPKAKYLAMQDQRSHMPMGKSMQIPQQQPLKKK